MDRILMSCIQQLQDAILFLEKIDLDAKFINEKENLSKNLKTTLEMCQSSTKNGKGKKSLRFRLFKKQLPRDKSEENLYSNDAAETRGGGGEGVYDDTRVEANESIYDDTNNEEPAELYEDLAVREDAKSVSSISTIRTEPDPLACEELRRVRISSMLEQKREGLLKSVMWSKRWCVISEDNLYIYESAKDWKPKDCFSLRGEQVAREIADEEIKEAKRKGRCFSLKSGKKVFEFCASDATMMRSWMTHVSIINNGNGIASDQANKAERAGSSVVEEDTYDDIAGLKEVDVLHEGLVLVKKESIIKAWCKRWCVLCRNHIDIFEQVAKDNSRKFKGTFPIENCMLQTEIKGGGEGKKKELFFSLQDENSSRHMEFRALDEESFALWTNKMRGAISKRRSSRIASNRLPSGGADDVYDDTIALTTHDDIYDDAELPAPPGEELYDETIVPGAEDIYDDVSDSALAFPPLPISAQKLPPLPPVAAAASTQLSPAQPIGFRPSVSPADPVEKPDSNQDVDYSTFYQGMWDCAADEDNELSFKRGDLIQIISKEHDCFGWWMGKMELLTGYVPKVYLMAAYEC